MKVVIVDYGMGNIHSIVGTLKHLEVDDICVSSDKSEIHSADKIILPGVGSFAKAMNEIREKKIDETLATVLSESKKPLLGICLGMQLLGLSSTEEGFTKGLGFVNGTVDRFNDSEHNIKIPHVGFNQVRIQRSARLYNQIPDSPDFYFTHSYRMLSNYDIKQSICTYGEEFVASFEVENISGVQFHPELSQTNGLALLKNFLIHF